MRDTHWLTLTHTQRCHAHYHDVGAGHLYQGRFKSFPVAQDDHFLRLCRYVERNAARAGLVRRAEVWPWCSLGQRAQEPRPEKWLLSAWPVVVAEADWVRVAFYSHQCKASAARLARTRGGQSSKRPIVL